MKQSGKKTVVIVGASDQPDRKSYMLLQRLRKNPHYEPVLVNPRLKEIDGIPVSSSLAEVSGKPDVISLYLNAKNSQGLEDAIERLKPGNVIFNPGAENPELMGHLYSRGIQVEEACSLVLLSQNAL
jgi:predicted CoA-binding protein